MLLRNLVLLLYISPCNLSYNNIIFVSMPCLSPRVQWASSHGLCQPAIRAARSVAQLAQAGGGYRCFFLSPQSSVLSLGVLYVLPQIFKYSTADGCRLVCTILRRVGSVGHLPLLRRAPKSLPTYREGVSAASRDFRNDLVESFRKSGHVVLCFFFVLCAWSDDPSSFMCIYVCTSSREK